MNTIALEQARQDIKSIFTKHFPLGWCSVTKQSLGEGFVYRFGLIGVGDLTPNMDEITSKIVQNDPGFNSGMIDVNQTDMKSVAKSFPFILTLLKIVI